MAQRPPKGALELPTRVFIQQANHRLHHHSHPRSTHPLSSRRILMILPLAPTLHLLSYRQIYPAWLLHTQIASRVAPHRLTSTRQYLPTSISLPSIIPWAVAFPTHPRSIRLILIAQLRTAITPRMRCTGTTANLPPIHETMLGMKILKINTLLIILTTHCTIHNHMSHYLPSTIYITRSQRIRIRIHHLLHLMTLTAYQQLVILFQISLNLRLICTLLPSLARPLQHPFVLALHTHRWHLHHTHHHIPIAMKSCPKRTGIKAKIPLNIRQHSSIAMTRQRMALASRILRLTIPFPTLGISPLGITIPKVKSSMEIIQLDYQLNLQCPIPIDTLHSHQCLLNPEGCLRQRAKWHIYRLLLVWPYPPLPLPLYRTTFIIQDPLLDYTRIHFLSWLCNLWIGDGVIMLLSLVFTTKKVTHTLF